MKKILFILSLCLPFYGRATNYNWSVGSGNILINRTNFPTLSGLTNDTVFIPAKSGGYRSFSLANLNSGAPGRYIVIYWQTGAFITPSVSPIFANSMDSCYGVHIYGFTMNDNIDIAFTSYQNTAYSKYIWLDSCTFRGMNGIFNSGPQTFSLHAFTGDSTYCFYKWRFSKITCDSIVGANSGQTALWIGSVTSAKNQFWVDVEIDHCTFAHYSSSSNPASYIHAECVFGLKIHDNVFDQLGMNILHPVGHAAQQFFETVQMFLWNNTYKDGNFGDGMRIFGNADLPGWPAYAGKSFVHNDFMRNQRKYPFAEYRTVPGDTTTLSPWVRVRDSTQFSQITCYCLALGSGNMPYNACIIDGYGGFVSLHSSIYTVLGDTTLWTINNGVSQNALITNPALALTGIDSLNCRFVQFWVNSGIADSINFLPILNATLYNQAATVYSYITSDHNGVPYPVQGRVPFGLNTGVDIGAFLLPGQIVFIGPIIKGSRIIVR